MEAYYMWERVHITEDMSRSSSYCDCTTYSCFLISVFLFTLGTIILVFSLGAFALDTVFANLGHMWIVGLLCICSAVMIGIRNVLYLRRLQQIEDIRSQQAQLTDTQQYSLPIRTVSELTLPPSYEQLIGSHNDNDDLPPPSYEEAIVSMSKEATKSDNIIVLNYSVK
ncbi:uncharacterized protein LOC112689518 [Sipha flava]|uniref:Uncharacterized protein LOC112689518 n=1 Tax=Sipha flava TaxID=143950 RepID=A0A2S2Q0K2_9HEMI|nr:uncharacterized protein LOC112689518 [Sipha flava]